MIRLEKVHKKHPELLAIMPKHYSEPKGFVGRSICYLVYYDNELYGAIVGGSATKHLPGRSDFLKYNFITLENIVNNVFFHVEPKSKYPCRNFTQRAIRLFRERIVIDWREKYDDIVYAFETLVELPREGTCYRRDGWIEVGVTKGFTCKRTAGTGTDSWSGRRVWDTVNLRPKRVFVRWRWQ
jgi:hypothetical protein